MGAFQSHKPWGYYKRQQAKVKLGWYENSWTLYEGLAIGVQKLRGHSGNTRRIWLNGFSASVV
jgi:hypothetical protein